MISIESLKKIANIKGMNNIRHAEKDYLIELALLSISKNTKDELIFKGGTCLYKFYKLDRFSEDIDFTLRKGIDIQLLLKKIISDFLLFGIEAEIKENKKLKDSFLIVIRTKGPLYSGISNSLSNIRIDINTKSSIDLEPATLRYSPLYEDIPTFSISVMREQEVLSEKIRALMTRKKARDVYDIWHLLNRGVKFNIKVVNEKLSYYNLEWDIKRFERHILDNKKIWKTELKPLLNSVPDFDIVKKEIMEKLA